MGANRVSTENNRILIHVQGLQISEGFCLDIRVPFINCKLISGTTKSFLVNS